MLSSNLYIGMYDAAHMSNGLCSSYFTSHASVGVFSHTERTLRVYINVEIVFGQRNAHITQHVKQTSDKHGTHMTA